MTLIKANPRRRVRRHQSIFDHLFNDVMNSSFHDLSKNLVASRPSANVVETADGYKILLSIPGLSKDDISIDLEKNILTIKADKAKDKIEGETSLRKEFDFNKFERQFRLPKSVDQNKVNANVSNGILSITLAKKEEAKEKGPKAIEIK